MKKLYLLLLAVTMLYGCKKENEYKNVSVCALEMKERFKDDLKCTERGVMETHMYVGTYKNKKVYFSNTMCITCTTMPPQYGYTCDNKKIDFDDFKNVTEIKEVYDSCTDEFTE